MTNGERGVRRRALGLGMASVVLLGAVGAGLPAGAAAPARVRAVGLARGGTLRIAAEGDVGNLDTSQAYEVVAWTLMRAFTRQLVSYAGDPRSLTRDTKVEPDLAQRLSRVSWKLVWRSPARDLP